MAPNLLILKKTRQFDSEPGKYLGSSEWSDLEPYAQVL